MGGEYVSLDETCTEMYRSSQKRKSLLFFISHHFLSVQFIPTAKQNLCSALIRHNTTQNSILYNEINSYTQDTIALQPNVLVAGIQWLLVINT